MTRTWLAILATALPALLGAQTGRGPYARIAVLRPREGHATEFEAGYVRHLAWHRQAGDPWAWYGWTVWAGERQRWFVYATFGRSAASLDSAVAPADDERDNVLNVVPHAEFVGNALYEYLPALSRGTTERGTGEPSVSARLELTTVELAPGAGAAFEAALIAALAARQGALRDETLWYRLVAGGAAPRYVRLRPRPTVSAVLDAAREPPLPAGVDRLVTRATVEILTLRPTMSLGLTEAAASPARE
jgi:hypothetical protein